MQSIFERICPHHSWTSSSPITTLKQMKPSEKPELTAQVHSWWMELEARQSQQGVITCAICFWMQFVRACIFWPSGHTAWAIYSPRHLLGNRNRISNRFPRGMPWFGRYLGNYITKKANYFKKKKKKRKNLKINEDMHHLLQIDPKHLWKICVTMTISLKKYICLTSKMEKFLTDGHWYYGL